MKKAFLFEKSEDGTVFCNLCAHKCQILPDKSGFCGVRTNDNGTLYTTAYGNVISSAVDPVEKKPLYHFLPGSKTFSIAVPGCNFRCGFCQNWEISQIKKVKYGEENGFFIEPAGVVQSATRFNCNSISFTYTEPVIFMEYAFETARIAKEAGLRTVFVSNGYMTKEALELIAPFLDACNIDLKAFTDSFYSKNCKAHLQPVLDSIERIYQKGIHIEVTTLVIPGENDSDEELHAIAGFISGISSDIPWHVSRFFPRYEFLNHAPTPAKTIQDAVNAGFQKGLHYVYAGNLHGTDCSTRCYNCQKQIVKRSGYTSETPEVKNGKCPVCGSEIYGIWG
jgi:pyruvate formate lyase activating enzyme